METTEDKKLADLVDKIEDDRLFQMDEDKMALIK